jgi:DNA-binding response OmpR family regulator
VRVLLVEDEVETAELLAKGLREHSYAVDVNTDGDDALASAGINDYDLVILDLMIPGRDGLEVCRTLRSNGSHVPILMLTARDAVADRVVGLDAGADDYLAKPFSFDELLARVRALLRRRPVLQPRVLQVGDLTVDTAARAVRRSGRAIELTAKEYALLEYLVLRSGEVVSRSEIAEHVWDEHYDAFSNLIEVYVQRLRRKLGAQSGQALIHTRRGQGYTLAAETGGDD